MTKLKNITIEAFRGILNLNVNDLSNVNLIVGDNNCGKTSILEAIQILRAPGDINNALRVSRMRDNSLVGISRLPIYDNFTNMLQGEADKILSVACEYEAGRQKNIVKTYNASVKISGSIKQIMFDANELFKDDPFAHKYQLSEIDSDEIEEFNGDLITSDISGTSISPVKINRFTNVTGRTIARQNLIKITYLAPFAHITQNTFDKIIRNTKYKEICITMLKMFDENIEDLLLLKSEHQYRPVEYVRNKINGLMPLSTYGDGIKKVLSIANAIAQSSDGILLIDEIETAIHSKYYDDIFKFIIKAAMQYNVQLFITTHSIEAVDGLLNTQIEGNKYSNLDHIKVITLRKDISTGKTLSRTLTGKEVYEGREKFNFEVRI